MRTKSIINAIKKAGIQVEYGEKNRIDAVNGNTVLTFYDQDGTAVCVHYSALNNCGDTNPWNSDCYTTFPKTLKRAIEALVSDAWGKKQ